MTRFILSAGLATVAAVAPAAAQLSVAAPADVLAATRSCIAASGNGAVDGARLEADGWRRGTASSDGQAVETPLSFYGRPNGNVVLMTGPGAAGQPQVCLVTARVADVRGRGAVQAALTGAFGDPIQSAPDGILWRAPSHIVQLAATGSDAQPAVRVAVAFVRGVN
ncbi:hypothetical protein GGR88_001966 [Sphingomonas jejuensis]|uniref:Uncharacterized protein n=1 Tax=Sphingomonas jejuensis TaxID=904715 RepID=A0ABX0XM48_9SPHN|nr:hypothetical protein [Sphingomonas jejuensis]NJC34452.1 hypothetical protein [Sphingomonas jejuensis]